MKRRRVSTIAWILPVLTLCLCQGSAARHSAALASVEDSAAPSPQIPAKFPDGVKQKIRSYVEAALKNWNVPGAAVGIVKDGQVVFLEGFGKRDIEMGLPVTPRTRFILGSTTKAFTALTLALLAADRMLEWDKPVSGYIPEFRLWDEYATLHATARDLASHRAGLPRHDFVWVNTPMDLPEIVRSLRFLEPNRELRAAYQYNNLMYMALGYLVERVSGKPWDDFVRERIFKPLAMNDSGCTIPEYLAADERAIAYMREKEKFVASPLPPQSAKLMYGARASGSINTTAEDMCRWMVLHLSAYIAGAKTAIPAAVVRQTHAPQVPIGTSPVLASEIQGTAYGLGWMSDVYRTHRRIYHGGSTLEFNSNVALFPQDGIGVVILINASSPANEILLMGISDLALGLTPVDWEGRLREMLKNAGAGGALQDPRVQGTTPAHKLDDYAGDYLHPAYGPIHVELKDGRLSVMFHGFVSPLEHWHYETFQATENEIKGQKWTFQTDVRGDVASVSARLESAVKDIVFERRGKT